MADQITKSVIVQSDPQTVFNLVADFKNYPKFLNGIHAVQAGSADVTRWKVDAPLGVDLEFDVETTLVEPPTRVGWNSKDRNKSFTTSGQIVVAELPDNQTHVTVTVNYEIGGIGGILNRGVDKKVEDALHDFKQYVEGLS